jgi:ferredoxin-NADP reductase
MTTLKLIEKEHLVDNVWAFRFEIIPPFTWTAGQFIYVELPQANPDQEGTKRWFTVSAAPYQGIVQITTRITETTFKQALSKIEIGGTDLQLIDKPDGDFVWEETDLPRIFVAGGIGITPFYSIIKQRVHDGLPINVTLVYGARNEDSVPFKDEFNDWSENDPNFNITYVTGEPLTAEKLATIKPDLNTSLVYLSGPEPMIEALGDQLKAAGLPEKQLKQDFFPNYTEENY